MMVWAFSPCYEIIFVENTVILHLGVSPVSYKLSYNGIFIYTFGIL